MYLAIVLTVNLFYPGLFATTRINPLHLFQKKRCLHNSAGYAIAFSYIVEKHIFGKPTAKKKRSKKLTDKEIQYALKRISFRGVVKTGKIRQALVGQKSKRRGNDVVFRKVGEKIEGWTIKFIGNDFVVITSEKGDDFRLNLYESGSITNSASGGGQEPLNKLKTDMMKKLHKTLENNEKMRQKSIGSDKSVSGNAKNENPFIKAIKEGKIDIKPKKP